jgi:GH24 family phage-related lysozyme (muramidase)
MLCGLLNLSKGKDMTIKKTISAVVVASVIAISTPFIAKWEGLETTAYRDIVGVPTVCYGETRGVKMGDTYTKEQCMEMLKKGVAEYYAKLQPYMTNPNIPISVQASMLELAYNVGVSAVGNSTMMRLANQGKYVEACNELSKWVRAGGKVVKGLENRRADSKYNLCLKGLR